MASPFPGMDPFMEEPTFWPGVHNRLIIYLADTLNEMVPPHYVANVEERVVLTEPPTTERYPDVHVVRQRRKKAPLGASTGSVALLEADPPLKVESAEARESYIEIHRPKKPESLVAVLEILSPTNKRQGDGREKYLEKQAEVMDRPAHLIEIDLLRAGNHTVAIPREWLPANGWDYLVCLHRAGWPEGKFECWPTALPQRLPRFAVPLANGDPDVIIDLQAMLTRCYGAGKFAQKIHYRGLCPPPALSKKDAKWVDELLRKKKLRK